MYVSMQVSKYSKKIKHSTAQHSTTRRRLDIAETQIEYFELLIKCAVSILRSKMTMTLLVNMALLSNGLAAADQHCLVVRPVKTSCHWVRPLLLFPLWDSLQQEISGNYDNWDCLLPSPSLEP